MNSQFHFGRFELAAMIVSTIVFGGCVLQLLLGKLNVTLVFLTILTFGVLVSLVGRAHRRGRSS
jgi:hypothetical protein